MSSAAKPDTRTTEQVEKETADRIEAAILYDRIRQAAAWRRALGVSALLAPSKILTQN